MGSSEKELLQLWGNIYETRDLTFSDMVLHYFTWKNNLFERKQWKMVIWNFSRKENTHLKYQCFALIEKHPYDNTGNSNIHKHVRLNENKEVFCTQKTVNYPALFFFREKVSFPGALFTFTHLFLQRQVLCSKVAHQQMSFLLQENTKI